MVIGNLVDKPLGLYRQEREFLLDTKRVHVIHNAKSLDYVGRLGVTLLGCRPMHRRAGNLSSIMSSLSLFQISMRNEEFST